EVDGAIGVQSTQESASGRVSHPRHEDLSFRQHGNGRWIEHWTVIEAEAAVDCAVRIESCQCRETRLGLEVASCDYLAIRLGSKRVNPGLKGKVRLQAACETFIHGAIAHQPRQKHAGLGPERPASQHPV